MSQPPLLHTIPITKLTGVGPVLKEKLAKLAIHSVQDVLFHLPYRYQDRTQVTPIQSLQVGEYAVVEGVVVRTQIIRARVNILQVDLQDTTGCIALKFFHFTPTQQQKFLVGGQLRFFGQVKGYGHDLSLIHPERLDLQTLGNQHMQQSLTPIYATTEGVNQKTWWHLTEQALALLKQHAAHMPDLLPNDWIQAFQLPDLASSLELLHRPPQGAQVSTLLSGTHPAQQRLIAEELLAHHLSLRALRTRAKRLNAVPLQKPGQLVTELIKKLPFSFTLHSSLHKADGM